MPSPSVAIMKKTTRLSCRYPELLVFFQPSFKTRDIHIPFSDTFGLKKRSQWVELLQISLMNHCGHGDLNIGFREMIDRLNRLIKSALAPEGLMALFHPVKADLGFVDTKSFGHLFSNSCAIGEKDGPKCVIPQDIIDLPKIRVQQRFPSGEEEAKSLDFFKFF
jgi:hypothetical protein